MTGSNHADMANAIRFLSADAVQKANSGHPGMPMGMADVATVLFSKFLKYDPKAPNWHDRDRFVLSAGHGSMLLYSLLHLTGYEDMTLDELKNFRQLGAKTAGHPEYGHAEGIEITTGPLGQGIASAVGMALGERMMNARFGDDLVDHWTYVIAGDGCLMEGVSQEAISLAGSLKTNKLIVLWDDNDICIDGPITMTTGDDQAARFKASNWNVDAVDGHDAAAVEKAIAAAKKSDKPTLIACKTTIGRGAPNKEGTSATHGAPLGDEELALAREAMNWPHGPFEIPGDVSDAWREVGGRGSSEREAWEGRLGASDTKDEFERAMNGELPEGWQDAVNAHKKAVSAEAPGWATRVASGKALEVLTKAVPEMIGGSADLTGSVNTKTAVTDAVTADDYSGRYVHYGVREHGMASAMNGLALHGGAIPYSGTFLVFADYMRGAIRLSALMEQRVVYVLTHDSIGLGEDGPTHQAVETVASLRAMPNFHVYRPCDGVETAECWALALGRKDGPAGMVLTRQGLPTQRVEHTDENLSARGGYVLAEADGGDRQVTLFATGSEVSVAMQARDMLQADGTPTAVVSMPCWELFDEQDEAYQKQVKGPGTVRVAVEAAIRMGWDKYIRSHGGFVGMTGFGASAPAGELFEHFGITPAKVVEAAKSRL
ncbi:MAG: transketolase [Alphaproteobacteria bacterium]|jgi:transketolase|nr:transketolase [Alphaproteobacteria bacterium]MBT7942732.1 transketolase [Alphaproteobacteria bacterium]